MEHPHASRNTAPAGGWFKAGPPVAGAHRRQARAWARRYAGGRL